jgi:starch-binding outer membrane protein, SusD/RagB family
LSLFKKSHYMKYTKFLTILLASALIFSCTKLDEELRDSLNAEASTVNAAGLLQSAYESMNSPLQDQARLWSSAEHTTDEALGPTRGPDWDDNGVWRVLHSHKWDADHGWLRDTYRELLSVQFSATTVLTKSPTPAQAAEARFIRALSTFYVLDGWDQVPYRTDLTDLTEIPPTIKGSAAADTIIKELNESLPSLTEGTSIRANKDAARALLMKLYLNKGVYANRAAPTFAAADMDQVIALADLIINNPKYVLNGNYFGNFAWDNLGSSQELIYALENTTGLRGGNVRFHWFCGLNYSQKPSGWNGFCTLADFYDKFEASDVRRGGSYPGVTDVSGLRSGFLVGQQFDQNNVPLIARDKSPLAFTRKVALTEVGPDLERTGIRVMKYLPDYKNTADQQENEKVVFRLADIMLMKAEALLRKGNAAGALTIMNQIRATRGATPLASATTANLLEERGRELYWEGWRRNDLIRFGKFLDPIVPAAGLTSTRPEKSEPYRLIFAIPNQQLAVNPNLVQNPGYK